MSGSHLLYHIAEEGAEWRGPYTLGQLREFWRRGEITVRTLWCCDGSPDVRHISQLVRALEPAPAHALSGPEPISGLGHLSVALLGLLVWPVGVLIGLAYLASEKTRPRGQLLIIWSAVGLLASILLWVALAILWRPA